MNLVLGTTDLALPSTARSPLPTHLCMASSSWCIVISRMELCPSSSTTPLQSSGGAASASAVRAACSRTSLQQQGGRRRRAVGPTAGRGGRGQTRRPCDNRTIRSETHAAQALVWPWRRT